MRSWVNPSNLGASSVKWDIIELYLPVLNVGEQMSHCKTSGFIPKGIWGIISLCCVIQDTGTWLLDGADFGLCITRGFLGQRGLERIPICASLTHCGQVGYRAAATRLPGPRELICSWLKNAYRDVFVHGGDVPLPRLRTGWEEWEWAFFEVTSVFTQPHPFDKQTLGGSWNLLMLHKGASATTCKSQNQNKKLLLMWSNFSELFVLVIIEEISTVA